MALITQHDFETKMGQQKIARTLHGLESKIHELEKQINKLKQEDKFFERDLEGPESY